MKRIYTICCDSCLIACKLTTILVIFFYGFIHNGRIFALMRYFDNHNKIIFTKRIFEKEFLSILALEFIGNRVKV